jgi:SpoVK/Ycf46/Vps4 family AAA+-type ATPase
VRGASTATDIVPACRELAATASLELATRIHPHRTRDSLVLPAAVTGELDLAIAWARTRTTVLDDWGFGSRVHSRGLSILLAGKPGTGKTSAAHVLATEIGLDLLHVDLAQVVNKYIGETEKRLARLFDEAGTGAVLFFDEADALFGKRSQVRDAHDRHANIEVGYLLQRIEQHDGVTILATNRYGDLDEAFLRRFHVSIAFPVPTASDRALLWQRMLPAEAPRAPELPLDRIAADYELAGGDIQTAVLAAAVLAADAREPIAGYHLYRGIQRVLAKNGVLPDARLLRIVRGEPEDVTRSTHR